MEFLASRTLRNIFLLCRSHPVLGIQQPEWTNTTFSFSPPATLTHGQQPVRPHAGAAHRTQTATGWRANMGTPALTFRCMGNVQGTLWPHPGPSFLRPSYPSPMGLWSHFPDEQSKVQRVADMPTVHSEYVGQRCSPEEGPQTQVGLIRHLLPPNLPEFSRGRVEAPSLKGQTLPLPPG